MEATKLLAEAFVTAPANSSYANGISQVNADQLCTFTQWCVTASQLRAFSPNPAVPNLLVYMEGYSAANDGGQGFFYWNTTTGTDDSGLTTIVPSGSTAGCWTRLQNSSSSYNPQTVNGSANTALTAVNVTNQVLVRTGGSTPVDGFPVASAIIGAMSGAQVGSIRDLLIINENSGNYSLIPNTGVTFIGNLSAGDFVLPTLTQRSFKIHYTSSSSITVYG